MVKILKFQQNKSVISFLNLVSIGFKKISFVNLKIRCLRQKKYDEVVIVSVDNLSFGGTGKTTMAAEIGEKLQEKGIKFAVVSRGYKSKYEKSGLLVELSHTAEEVGDEAKLLKTRFPGQDVLIGKNRHDSIKRAVENKNRVIILDDGFQSTDIYKDITIMLVNPLHPYYYLRNFKFLMKNEDYILFYNPGAKELTENTDVEAYGEPLTGSYHFKIENFYDVKGNIIKVNDSALFGFSALGDNRRFKNDLAEFNLFGFKSYKDHYAFVAKEINYLDNLRKEVKADYLVCTEKDYIKIMNYNLENIPLIYAKNTIQFNIDLTGIILKHVKKKNEYSTQSGSP